MRSGKILKTFVRYSRFVIVFLLAFGWIFAGWPQIWNNPPFPPKIQIAVAASQTFSSVGTTTDFAIPAGVTLITVKAWGAGGGGGGGGDNSPAAPGGTGAGGGYITGAVSVTPGEFLTIVIGDDGKGGNGDVTNGGGGGGGGGYTLVGRSTNFYGAASTSILFLAAGGGGGGGGDDTTTVDGGAGGAGGGSSGVDGVTAGSGLLGAGGTQVAGGAGGTTNCDLAGANGGALFGGGGGAQTGTNAGLGGAGGINGGARGGNGNITGSDSGGAGAGGAGYFGGGGGCTDESTDGAGGGGGGSSFATTTATGVTNTAGSGVDPGNNLDSDYTASCSGLGAGGSAGAAGSGNGGAGTNGCVLISWITPPTVTTQAASSVTATAATLNGNITATGGANATVRGFAWGTNSGLSGGDTATTTESGSFSTGAFTNTSLTLVCNTTYYSRAYATNSAGDGLGAISASFTTSACASLTFNVSTNVFPSVTPGSPVFATSTLSVDTDNATGWNVTVSRDDADTTLDLDTDATVNITDQTEWIPGAATTTTGNAVRISSFTNSGDVLAFRVMTASGTVSFISTSWWGTTDAYIDSATTLWAGIASSTAANLKIGNSSVSSGGSAKLNTVLYYLNVPSTQRTGAYSGGITYTATMNP